MTTPQLIISGSVALDRIMNFDGSYADMIQADKLHVLSVSILLDKLEDTPGGVGANIAHNCAFLGENPILLGSVGKDAASYVRDLAKQGINMDFVHTSKLSTATFNVITDKDDNQVGGFYPGAMSDSASLSLRRWKDKDVFICVSAHDQMAMDMQVSECKQFGLRLMYDPGQQVSNISGEDLAAGVEAAEVLILNDYEFGVLTQKTGLNPAAIKSRVPVVITTLGKAGSIIEGKSVKTAIKVPIAKPARVADPTGAGDAYRAGFLHGYLRQWELEKCGQLGAVMASFALEAHGTQVTFSKTAITERYKQTFNQEIKL